MAAFRAVLGRASSSCVSARVACRRVEALSRTSAASTTRRRRRRATSGCGQPKKNPHSAAHYGVYAFKPKSPLALVDTGIDPYMGVAVWLEAHKQNEFKYRPAQDRTAVPALRRADRGRESAGAGAAVHRADDVLGVCGRARAGHAAPVAEPWRAAARSCAREALGIAAALGLVLLPATVFGVTALTLGDSDGVVSGDLARGGAAGRSPTWCTSPRSSRCRSPCRRGRAPRARRSSCCSRSGSSTVSSRRGSPPTSPRRSIPRRPPSSSSRRSRPTWQRSTRSRQRLERRKAELLRQLPRHALSRRCRLLRRHLAAGRRESRQRGLRPPLRPPLRPVRAQNRVLSARRPAGADARRALACRWVWRAPTSSTIATSRLRPRRIAAASSVAMNDDIVTHEKGRGVPRGPRALGEGAGVRLRGAPVPWVLGRTRWSSVTLGLWLAIAVVAMLRSAKTAAVD